MWLKAMRKAVFGSSVSSGSLMGLMDIAQLCKMVRLNWGPTDIMLAYLTTPDAAKGIACYGQKQQRFA
jgi:hypothetical protein